MRTAVLGLPRGGSGGEREAALRQARRAGIDVIPSGDFSLVDHMSDTASGLGVAPPSAGATWFDTDYSYLVPELRVDQEFEARPRHWVSQYEEAKALGIETRPVLVGPFTFLRLAKGLENPYRLLDRLLPAYEEILNALAAAGAYEVQIDEPALALDQTKTDLEVFEQALTDLAVASIPGLSLTVCFGGLDRDDTLLRLSRMPLHEVHLDLVEAPAQLEPALKVFAAAGPRLSLGLVDGLGPGAADLDLAKVKIDSAAEALGADRLTIATSCSLLHLPGGAAAVGERLDELVRLKRSWSGA